MQVLFWPSHLEWNRMKWTEVIFFYAAGIRCSLALPKRRKDFAFHVKRLTHD